MKPSPLLISLAVLVHLSVVDLTMFLLITDLSVNYMVIIGYNFIWLIIALMIAGQALRKTI